MVYPAFQWFTQNILNINTIWAVMILVGFGFCVGQHYVPTTTRIDVGEPEPGTYQLGIGVARTRDFAAADDPATRVFELTVTGAGELRVPDEAFTSDGERPYLIEAALQDGRLTVTWDCERAGYYRVALNDQRVAQAPLVKLQTLTDAAFRYAELAFNIALGLVSAMVMFLGLMRVGEKAGVVQIVSRGLYPIIRFLFPDVPKDHPANGAILMNWTTTLLGLGNAATPFGIKAMQELQKLNPNPKIASDSQVMLLGYNTAGLALLPTTLLAVRKAADTSDPTEIIGTCMLAGAVSTVVAIIAVKVLGALPIFSREAAVRELQAEEAASGAAGTTEEEAK